MRKVLAVLLVGLAALTVHAQRTRDGRGTPQNPNPVDANEMLRAQDELTAKQFFEASAAEKPLRSVRLKDAVRDFKVNDFPVAPLHVTYGEFVTGTGYYYVAMHFAPPPDAKVPADGKVTFFAEMAGDGGGVLWTREEPVALARTPAGAWYYERSFPFPPGNRVGTFGLAVKDQPLAMASTPMHLSPLEKATRRMSRLIVSKHVFPLDKPQAANDPFSFGGIKVIPNAARAFRRSDELWIFYEAQNPALDGEVPKLTTSVQLEPASADGKARRYGIVPADPIPLKGVPGHFGVGTTVDISRLAPGEYLLRVGVADAVAMATYELVEKVTIVE